MKRALIISIFLLSLLIISSGPVLAADYTRIKGSTLVGFLEDATEELIIDVREPELFAEGHVPGAINIEYKEAKMNGLDNITKDKGARIVFVCHGGPMGDTLSRKLVKQGYTNVYNLVGGMYRWQGPVTK
jgi:rhodanese-related sulfurtransferase